MSVLECEWIVPIRLDLVQPAPDAIIVQNDPRHIELHSVSEWLDTSTPHGHFVLTLFGRLAQMERELIGERTRVPWSTSASKASRPVTHPMGLGPMGLASAWCPCPERW